MSTVRTDWNHVEVRTSAKSGRNYYAGLMACGSVWVCPICAPKIQKVRADELRAAIAAARSQGLQVAMLTPTIPHTRYDNLADLLEGFTGALGALMRGRAWTKHIRPTFGVAGYVRGLETTWGEATGWHPHAHILLFLDQGADLAELADALFPSWETAVKNRGLGQVSRAAFTLQDGTHANAYIAKMGSEWGPAEELVLSHTKSASGVRYSPFDLLGEYADGEHDAATTARFGRLFVEYANAYKGRRQLQWSQGLKRQLLGTEGLTDEEIADSLGEADPVLAIVTHEQWQLVKRVGLRGTLLMVADHHGADGVRLLLRSLAASPGEQEPRPGRDKPSPPA